MHLLFLLAQTILDKDTVNLPAVTADQSTVTIILNLVWKILGMLSVLFVAIGGLKYVLSNGDANQVNSAKNTILYAVIGLVISLSVYMIVTFVLGKLK